MLPILGVCLRAKAGWLSERLQPRWRRINRGEVTEASVFHTPLHLSYQMRPVQSTPHHFSSSTSMYCVGHLFRFVHSVSEKIKWINFPVVSLSDLHRFPRITWEHTRVNRQQKNNLKKNWPSENSMTEQGQWIRVKRRVKLNLKFNFDRTWPLVSRLLYTYAEWT